LSFRLIQISDTHLSPGKTHFTDNWAPLARWIAEQRPDLVIHTGDVTVDGANVEADMRHTAELMRRLGVRFRTVPGNHDVGDAGHSSQPVSDERLRRWRTYFGFDRWVEDVEDWRFIGLDALLFSSGEPEETVQANWLETVMNEAAGRRIAWFLHRPLFLDNPSEGDTGYWSVKPQARERLLDLIKFHAVALVASGHLHKAHDFWYNGTRYIWAPSSAFLVGPGMKAPPMPGENRLGAVVYDIDKGAIEAKIVAIPGLSPHWIDDVVEDIYPRDPDKRAATPLGLCNR
jgi:3',5'-cyclic AMP phosphodiesterase CpdA